MTEETAAVTSPATSNQGPGRERPLAVGFVVDQIAGHVTSYRNLRRIVEEDATIEPTWLEIEFEKPSARLERTARSLRVPPYVTGVARGLVEVRKALHHGPFDVIYCNSSVASMFTRPLTRTPTMLHLDSTPHQLDEMPTYPGPSDPAPIAAVKQHLSQRLFTSVAAIQAWSNWARDSFIADYGVAPERVTVNPPGVDLDIWQPRAGTRERRPDGPVRVLFVGADFERKGGPLLLDWWRRQPLGTAALDVVTRDPLTAEPGLHVHRGLTPNSAELRALYADADVFVLPSLGECFGIATVEAMASGLPVVASDAGGSADIVVDGENGFLVPAGDQRSLDEAMARLCASSAMRGRMGQRSRDLAAQRFDLGDRARTTIALLRGLGRP